MSADVPFASVAALIATLKRLGLLEPGQLADVERQAAADPAALARSLVGRGWLTAFQVNRLFQGRGSELVVGPYVVLRPLGKGGMGQVFQARHPLTGRVVALKSVRPALLEEPAAAARFRQEIQAICRLRHANIVLAHHAEETPAGPVLVMEFCEGIDLETLVTQAGQLSFGRACDYARQAALGLHHAHERGLVHRDVKPSNLLVVGATVKLLDLGLARLRDAEGSGRLTHQGAFFGTPDFLAPEQARDASSADARADQYGLGATLYYLLSGQVPFPGGGALEKALRHQAEEPAAIETLCPELPAAAAVVLRRLMAKEPAARYATAADAAAALAPFCRSEEPSAPLSVPAGSDIGSPPSLPERITVVEEEASRPGAVPPARTRRRWSWRGTAAVVGATLLGVVGAVVALVAWPKPPASALMQQTDLPQKREKDPVPAKEVVLGPFPHQIPMIAFAPNDPEILAVAGGQPFQPENSGSLALWRWKEKTKTVVPLKDQKCISFLAFSPDGKLLVAAPCQESRGAPTLWDVKTLTCRATLTFDSPRQGVLALAFSPDSKLLVAGCADGSVRFWDLGDGDPRPWPAAHKLGDSMVAALAFPRPRDSQHLVCGTLAGDVHFVTLHGWEKKVLGVNNKSGAWGKIHGLAFSRDGRWLAAGTHDYPTGKIDRHLLRWDTAKQMKFTFKSVDTYNLWTVAFTPAGDEFLTGDQEGYLRRWDAETLELRGSHRPYGDWAMGLAFSPDDRYLAASGAGLTDTVNSYLHVWPTDALPPGLELGKR